MVLSVRKKIWLGTGFLFLLLLVTGGVSIFQILKLRNESREVLKNNYESLAYCHSMLKELDNAGLLDTASVDSLNHYLQLQQNNITEKGEAQLTEKLQRAILGIQSSEAPNQNMAEARQILQEIIQVNMQSIQLKNLKAEKTSETTLTIIEIMVAVVFLLAFTFLLNFPSVISSPISRLQEAIREISNKNYSHRIRMERKDEFGKVAEAFNEMAERLQYFESSNLNKLLFEKKRAEAVINSLKDASIGIDKERKILFANYEALELLGISATEIVGREVEEVCKANELFDYLMHNESKGPVKIVVDGRENYFTKEIIDLGQDEPGGRVIVLKNITSFKELDVAKTNFIATISHELKTPLASSDFSLRLLEDERTGQLTPEQKELITHLKQDNQRILKILSEILNMSQVEAGRIQLKLEAIEPSEIIDNAISTVSAAANDGQLKIERSVEPDLPLVYMDAEKTTWVLNNLLTNAIKHSQAGGLIETIVKREGDHVTFSIKDSGPGIAKEYQARLFERYFKVPGSKSKGTGLGLAISKEFIESQNGKIWVESEIGQGAVFSFSLPLAI